MPLTDETEQKTRRKRLLEQFPELKIDALLVTALPNVQYLTGFTGSNGVLLLSHRAATLFTDPRYTVQCSLETDCKAVTVKGHMWPGIVKYLQRNKFGKIGFEKDRIPFFIYDYLKEHLAGSTRLTGIPATIEDLRMIKSAHEIDLIRTSVATNSTAFSDALKKVEVGMSELQLAAELDYGMRMHGAEGTAFESIVASGERAALPHARPTSNPIQNNQLLLIDMGAMQKSYASDMTRTVFVGSVSPEWKKRYHAVLEAQMAAIAAIRHGAASTAPDKAARKVLDKHGLGSAFTHSTGHGLGLEIHEAPRLGKKDKNKLQSGMVVTVEPGIYLEGKGGIRIEDTVLVTNNGCEVLTPTSKELTII